MNPSTSDESRPPGEAATQLGERNPTMPLDIGEMVHVIERRGFDTDVRRHLFGVVDRVTQSAIRVTGYVFVYDPSATTFVRHKEPRTRVLPFTSGLIINVAPVGTKPEDVEYVLDDQSGKLTVSDGGAFSLDINEFGLFR
jgi:hypothetical protein